MTGNEVTVTSFASYTTSVLLKSNSVTASSRLSGLIGPRLPSVSQASASWIDSTKCGVPKRASVALGPQTATGGLRGRGTSIRIDPQRRCIVQRIVSLAAKQPVGVAVHAGSVWTPNWADYSVAQIDPDTGHVLRTIRLGSYESIPAELQRRTTPSGSRSATPAATADRWLKKGRLVASAGSDVGIRRDLLSRGGRRRLGCGRAAEGEEVG
jgi:hypothetical protein